MANLEIERVVLGEGDQRLIAGIDEAGRGAIAGSVMAAAVILPLHKPKTLAKLAAVNDSKQLSPKRREKMYSLIIKNALAWGIGETTAEIIDQIGILPATRLAMIEAITQLQPAPTYLLIDGRIRLANLPIPQQSIVRGDGKSLTIAAASIVAKVTRDRKMVKLDQQYPHYGFGRHKGYGTAYHTAQIEKHGGAPIHRFTFAPLRRSLL